MVDLNKLNLRCVEWVGWMYKHLSNKSLNSEKTEGSSRQDSESAAIPAGSRSVSSLSPRPLFISMLVSNLSNSLRVKDSKA